VISGAHPGLALCQALTITGSPLSSVGGWVATRLYGDLFSSSLFHQAAAAIVAYLSAYPGRRS